MLGHLAEIATQELRADTLFMGIGAVSVDQGLMSDSVPEILMDRALRRMARSVVVLADASKFERAAPGFVFGLEEVDIIVTDDARDARDGRGHPPRDGRAGDRGRRDQAARRPRWGA